MSYPDKERFRESILNFGYRQYWKGKDAPSEGHDERLHDLYIEWTGMLNELYDHLDPPASDCIAIEHPMYAMYRNAQEQWLRIDPEYNAQFNTGAPLG